MTKSGDRKTLAGLVLTGRKTVLTDHERALLDSSVSEVRSVSARTLLVRKGEPLDHSTLLLQGLLGRYASDRRGHRQFVSLHIGGDFVDLHAYPMKQLDHDIAAVSDAQVAVIPHTSIAAITRDKPDFARKLWFATLLDAAMHREWIFRLGRLDAAGRVCHFFAETGARLAATHQGRRDAFELAMTQADVAEACGLTNVHVSRVLKSLRADGICTFRDGQVLVQDYPGLTRRGQFDPSYLYLEGEAGGFDLTPVKGTQPPKA